MKTSCFLLLVGLIPLPAGAGDLFGRVVSVASGESLVVQINERERMNVRILGIHAPTDPQDFSGQSRTSLSAYTNGKEIRMQTGKKDARGRVLARVWTADLACRQADCPKTVDVGLAQVAAGLAWQDEQDRKDLAPADRQRYAEAEFMAKARRLGLWAGKESRTPGAWQRQRLAE